MDKAAAQKLNDERHAIITTSIRYRTPNNPITGRELARRIGVHGNDTAAVRRIVNQCRKENLPICSNRSGYYWGTQAWQVRDTINDLYHRIQGITNAIEGLEEVLSAMETNDTTQGDIQLLTDSLELDKFAEQLDGVDVNELLGRI